MYYFRDVIVFFLYGGYSFSLIFCLLCIYFMNDDY